MPVVTGQTLLDEVRDVADEPSYGDGAKSYVTDTFILRRLSDRYRRIVRDMLRAGYQYNPAVSSDAAPGSSVTLTDPIAILSVWVNSGTARRQLPRLVADLGPVTSGTVARYWYPLVISSGDVLVNLVPDEDVGTVEVIYISEPAALTTASSIFLPSAWKDVLVYGTGLDCYAKRNAQNQFLKDLYNEAKTDAEADAAHFASDNVVKNTDDLYEPGYPQFDERFDYSMYVLP